MINKRLSKCQKRDAKRSRAEASGRAAERLAADWYERMGFELLAQRARTALGEIDLVMANADTIIFVEVKARADERAAADAVTRRQQSRLVAAAEVLLAQHPAWSREMTRFDVVLVVAGAVVTIADAFRADVAGS